MKSTLNSSSSKNNKSKASKKKRIKPECLSRKTERCLCANGVILCVLYHYIGECWHHNSLRVEREWNTGQNHKRNEKASSGVHTYTHTHSFFFHPCRIIFLVWFLFALSTHTHIFGVPIHSSDHVLYCRCRAVVVVVIATAFITSNG